MQSTGNAQRARAASSTAFGNLNSKVDVNTKRMAGAALAAAMAPGLVAMVDDDETSGLEALLSGGITTAGAGIGGYLGHKGGSIAESEMDTFIRNELDKYKAEAKTIGKQDPAAAVEYFAEKKGQLIEDISAIDPKRAAVFNQTLRRSGEIGEMTADLDLLNKTPRQVRGMTRGAMLGAIAAALPAYLAM